MKKADIKMDFFYLENKAYYTRKGTKIYGDFLTYGQGKMLAQCNAIELCRKYANTDKEIVVCEYGVGDGNFAKIFLDNTKKIDKEIYANMSYFLFDFSEKMLMGAKRKLSSHSSKIHVERFDVLFDTPAIGFDYCRINELLTDLPARFFAKKDGSFYECKISKDGFRFASKTKNTDVILFLERIDEKRIIPFNFFAAEFIAKLSAKAKKGAWIDIFDYGFYSPRDILDVPIDAWNKTVVRKYAKQITTDLNFVYLLSAGASFGLRGQIEKQIEYAEKIIGRKLCVVERKNLLDYSISRHPEMTEDDGFYHLRFMV
ncbi:MAG: SAM-dependent methyltransferase [Candidatus Micrarchaeota archaeon]|nr:SAM-dependent methyltransferase [Candidatus Micrarchaeota archaeon]